MPPKLHADLDSIDLDRVLAGPDLIGTRIPQRHEMMQIEAVHHLDREGGLAVGSRRVSGDEWWVRGHIPGRPVFPGVLLVEAAAQLSTWLYKELTEDPRFFGFAALDGVRFRGIVKPGDRVVLLAKLTESNRRRAVFDCQAAVDGRLVFEGTITGMAV